MKSLKNKQFESAIYECPELPVSLPIKSLEDVIRIEEYLVDNDNLSTLVIIFIIIFEKYCFVFVNIFYRAYICFCKHFLQSSYLSTLGGRDLTTKINTILRNIFSNEVAVKYSFLGTRNGKKSFSASRLHRLVIRKFLICFYLLVLKSKTNNTTGSVI